MVQQQSILRVKDNSGAKTVKCLQVCQKYKKTVAKIGNIIIVSVKKTRSIKKDAKLRKKEVFKALVVETKRYYNKLNGLFIKSNLNSVVLIDKQYDPIGTRINGSLPKQFKKKFNKFVSITKSLI